MKRMMVLLAVILALAATGVSAQSLTGAIAGKVVDEQGAVLPGVTVTLVGKTGSVPTVTDERGEFRFVGLNPGTYEVKTELAGFAPRSESAVDVGIGRNIAVNFTLKVGAMTETVDVVGNAATVDITSTSTDNALSQDLLQNMPINVGAFNSATSLLNFTPGVNSGSGFGGDASYGNALLIDGVDTRDPEAGSAWIFFNFNIVEEVQVGGLGAPAEYGGFSGAVVNTITKSGGNKYSGLFEARYTGEKLAGKNMTADILKKNPALGSSNVMKKLTDYTVQLGGPLKKDKVFWWFSAQRFAFNQEPLGPRTTSTEISPRYNAKLTFQPTPNDTIIVSSQYDNYNVTGRLGFVSAAAATDLQTVRQDSPEAIWNGQYRKVFGSNTFVEAKFMGYWGYYYLDPLTKEGYHYDGATGAESGGAGYFYQADRGRNQVNVSVSQYADFAGKHNFKFGVEFERSKSWSRYGYQYFLDYEGEPYYLIEGSYNIDGRNKRESFYLQDQWQKGRLTANLGLRLDRIRGYSPKTDTDVYTPKLAIGPRVGVAFDVTGKGSTVLKGFWGRYYEGAAITSWQRAAEGAEDTVYSNVYSDGSLEEVDRIPPLVYSICSGETLPAGCNGNNINHLGLDEFNVALERQLRRDMRVSVTYIHRDYKNFINAVGPTRRWSKVNATLPAWGFDGADPLASVPRTQTVYRWDNRSSSDQDFLIQNTQGFQYRGSDGSVIGTMNPWRKYNGVMAVLTKSFSNRWQAQLSYVWSKTEGNVSNGGTTSVSGSSFTTPNTALLQAEGLMGLDRTHEVKAFAGYQIPVIDVNLNAYFRAISGGTYRATANVSRTLLGTSGSATLGFEPPGSRRNNMTRQIDLRAEKTLKIGVYRFGVFMDVQNLLNSATITGVQSTYPSRSISYIDAAGESQSEIVRFGYPSSIMAPRQITFGGRWSF